MKVEDLIAELSHLPSDAEVHFQYSSGDYWGTQVAPRVSSVESGQVQYSSYHRLDKVVDGDESSDKETKTVVLIG